MSDMTTKQEIEEVSEIIGEGGSRSTLFHHGIKMENSNELNGLKLYNWENSYREAARVATAMADRIHKAAFHLAKGGAK